MDKNKFTPPHPLKTAVLFLIFNRLDTTKQVFEAIKKAKPPRLYIAADGARASRDGEDGKVKAVRGYVMNNTDWDCEVKTLFREKNLGCKYAVSSAIDWFFENEEMGIILEDDCLPSQSFFWFCEELLERYNDNSQIGMISGNNFQGGIKRGNADYYFSIYPHIWGWASWANRWSNYNVDLNDVKDSKFIENLIKNKNTKFYWTKIFKKMKQKEINTWDYQWTFTLWKNKQLAILPNINLVENVGFGKDATHTVADSELANLTSYEIVLQNHPIDIHQDQEADCFTSKLVFRDSTLFQKIVNKLKRIIQ